MPEEMSDDIPTIMSHVSVGTNQFEKALEFYDKVLATLGARRIHEELQVKAVAYGKQFPEFWLQAPFDGRPATVGNGSHFAFLASSRQVVDEFYAAALAAGGSGDGDPGPREHYGPAYYGGFARDLDGNKIEAMYWDQALA